MADSTKVRKNITLTTEAVDMLDRLAKRNGTSQSVMIELLIRNAVARGVAGILSGQGLPPIERTPGGGE